MDDGDLRTYGWAEPMSDDDPFNTVSRRASWDIVRSDALSVTIRDVGHTHGKSVTNDAEHVVEELAEVLGGRRLFYYDSDGRLDEILVKDGRFAGFRPGPTQQMGDDWDGYTEKMG